MLGTLPRGKWLLASIVVTGALFVPQAAQAAIPSALGVPCTEQGDGVRFCTDAPRSTVESPVDGVPIDVNVAFPPEPAAGPDGNFPLVMMFHGYGGGKLGLSQMERWLDRGYATFSMTTRGFRESCGSVGSKAADPAGCADGYVRLIDNRYEVRDAQEFAGLLADEGPGLIDPQRIGAIGGSYGGGVSIALGALRDRVVNLDYGLEAWQSPAGKPMQIAAAAPNIPWTDLAYSLVPNGGTLDYVADAPYRGRPGVEKQSLVNGLYLSGQAAPGFYAPIGTDPTADLNGWFATLEAGEPYGAEVQSIIEEITQHHSSYYIDDSIPPAPMLMSSGFTDDLFPADETIRYYNRTKTRYPDADLGLFFGDFGHPRAQNKDDVTDALNAREEAWFDHFIKGEGAEPPQGVEAFTLTCPGDAPSGGPYTASNWATISPGEVRFEDAAEKTIAPDSTTGGQFNPIGSNACTSAPDEDTAGAAVYELGAAPAGGYTLMGAVSVIADFTLPGDTSQVAARLLDVAPDGKQTLVNRGLWRPASGGPTRQVFQLFPNGWTFAEGHVPKLELIAADASPGGGLGSYGRASNNQQPVTLSNLELRMPVLERPGALDGLVKAPSEKFLPDGYELAADFAALPKRGARLKGKRLHVRGKRVAVNIVCPAAFEACNDGKVLIEGKLKPRKGKRGGKGSRAKARVVGVAKGSFDDVAGGQTVKLKLKVSKKARRFLKQERRRFKATGEVRSAENAEPRAFKKAVVAKKKKGKGRKRG